MFLLALYLLQYGGLTHPSYKWFFLLAGTSFAFTLLSAYALKAAVDEGKIARAQPPFDILCVTALVYLSGGWSSPLVFFYELVIIGAAATLFMKGALVTATISALAYGILTALQFNGLIGQMNPFPLASAANTNPSLSLGLHIMAFYAVAFLSSALAEEVKRTSIQLEAAEDEIQDLEHLQAAILSSMGMGLVALNTENRLMFQNPVAKELLSRINANALAAAELKQIFDLTPGGRRETLVKETDTVLGYSISPLSSRHGEEIGKILAFQDLTNIKALEKELHQADQLAAVGRLAAGLAHEIRNPLASLSGSVQMLSTSLKPEELDRKKLLAIVYRETERLNHLVTDFLSYARPGETRKSLFDLHTLIEESGLFFMQGEGRERFSLANKIAPETRIEADREQIAQLILNLFRNSTEAKPGNVTVTISGRATGNAYTIKIADDGPGFAPQIAARAFEPFFSGKEGGTGLGLASVHRIAQNHRGTVRLGKSSGGGALITLRLTVG